MTTGARSLEADACLRDACVLSVTEDSSLTDTDGSYMPSTTLRTSIPCVTRFPAVGFSDTDFRTTQRCSLLGTASLSGIIFLQYNRNVWQLTNQSNRIFFAAVNNYIHLMLASEWKRFRTISIIFDSNVLMCRPTGNHFANYKYAFKIVELV